MNNDGLNVKLHIQTPTKEPGILSQLGKYESVIINPFAKLDKIPEIFSEADILVLANDFDKEGIDYLKVFDAYKSIGIYDLWNTNSGIFA